MTRSAALLTLLTATGLAMVCGSSGDGAGPDRAAPLGERPAAQVEPGTRAKAGATEGELGDATASTHGASPRELSDGGPLDATAPSSERRREGVGAGAACSDVDLDAGAGNLGSVTRATTCLLNGERQDRGLVPLTPNRILLRAATAHARDMVAHSYFSHTGSDGSQSADRIRAAGYMRPGAGWVVGENLAWGGGGLSTPRAIVGAWMDSPGHRENILTPEFRDLGLAVVAGNPQTDDGSGATYASEFGALQATVRKQPRRATAPRPRAKSRKRAAAASRRVR